MAALFAIIAASISGFFASTLLRRWRTSRRLQELSWGVSLAMYAVASLAVAAGAAQGWDFTTYRIFWLFGAVLTVPWLALGSIALSMGRTMTWVATALVAILQPVALVATVTGKLAIAPFLDDATGHSSATKKIPRGAEVWDGSLALSLGRWASIVGWVVVVGIAVWTSRPRRGMSPPKSRVQANLLISIGVSVVAIGGFALGRVGKGEAFSVALAVGVAVMYVGFLLAGRAPRYTVTDPGASPT